MTTPDAWVTTFRRIEEQAVPGKPLGRHVRHDSRNRAYPWQASGAAPASQMWARHGSILDQGQLGSCTGNAETGALECDPCYAALPPAHSVLDEALAVAIYSAAEKLDGGAGYPPEDEGSSGPSAAQAAKNMGLISGYLHCFSLAAVLDALQQHPVCIGSNWYEGMDSPDSSGLVTISGSVRGGHEYLCRGVDVSKQLLHFDNSWGTSYGVNGSFSYSYATLDRLLHEQGDATVSLPLTVIPPPPVPVPDANPDDGALAAAVTDWASSSSSHLYRKQRAAVRTWLHAKGFTR